MKHQTIALTITSLILLGCSEVTKNSITQNPEPQADVSLQPCIGEVCDVPPEIVEPKSVQMPEKTCLDGARIQPKRIWAKSFIWAESPKIEVEKWIGEVPDLTKKKFIILEFWNTWCPPCRNSLPKLTQLQEKFKEDITVIALSNESVEDIKALEKKHGVKLPNCYLASSPNKVTRDEFGVRGVPHVVVIETESNCVIWEGYPLQKGHELTEGIIEKIIKISKK